MPTRDPPSAGTPSSASVVLPAWLGGRRVALAAAFAPLFFLTHSTRAVLLTVIPLQALELLGDVRAVSLLYLGVSVLGIMTSLSLPLLVLRIRTRGVFVAACVISALAAVLLATPVLPVFVLGMIAYVFSCTALELTMSLYTMHLVPVRDLQAFEPRRVLFSASAFCIGPWLGVWLETRVAHAAPFVLTALAAAAAFGYARFLGLHEAGAPARLRGSVNPFANLRRFFGNGLLRLSWAIAAARTVWWTTFFIYTPLYAVSAGLGETAGGALVSVGVATVFTVTYWGRQARRHGLRRLLVTGFLASGVASVVMALGSGTAWAGAALLLVAALATATIDGAGNVVFFRAVRASQRSGMAGVYNTFRDFSQLVSPAVAAAVLSVFAVPAVFGVIGLGMLAMSWYSRFLPRRM